jgi:hypothetical protein
MYVFINTQIKIFDDFAINRSVVRGHLTFPTTLMLIWSTSMTIYKPTQRDTKIARKIYEQYNGIIPTDTTGRRYEIHHLDGDHDNNDISNLVAVTIQEHYDLHYQQEDWGACYAIGVRMKMDPVQLSKLSSDTQNRRVAEGTHHFVTNNPTYRMLEDGTHPFLNSERQRKQALRRAAEGSNPFCDGGAATARNLKRVANGTHPFLGGEIQRANCLARVENGTHPFLDADRARELANKRLAEGTHNFTGPNSPSQQQWTCNHCGKSGKGKGNFTKHHGDNCKHKS